MLVCDLRIDMSYIPAILTMIGCITSDLTVKVHLLTVF